MCQKQLLCLSVRRNSQTRTYWGQHKVIENGIEKVAQRWKAKYSLAGESVKYYCSVLDKAIALVYSFFKYKYCIMVAL